MKWLPVDPIPIEEEQLKREREKERGRGQDVEAEESRRIPREHFHHGGRGAIKNLCQLPANGTSGIWPADRGFNFT